MILFCFRLKLETLQKCEEVIVKLYYKVVSKLDPIGEICTIDQWYEFNQGI